MSQTGSAAASEMIVMRADDNRFVFENWIGAVENADDVVGGNFATDHVNS